MPATSEPLFAADVARLQEARQARACADLADEALWIAGGAVCYGASADWIVKAFGLGLAEPVTRDEIDHMLDFWDERGVSGEVELCPYAHPSFASGLARAGYAVREFENVLARALPPDEDLRALHPHGWPAHVEVVPVDVDVDAQVDLYCEISSSGFRDAASPLGGDELAFARRIARHPRHHAFLAVRRGEAVGAGAVEVSGPIAALFGATVLPGARQHGVQTALALARLERARALGARVATIESKPGHTTERNAQRLGFFVAYTKAILGRPG